MALSLGIGDHVVIVLFLLLASSLLITIVGTIIITIIGIILEALLRYYI